MKELKKLIQAEDLDASTLELLYEHGDERAYRLMVTERASRAWAVMADLAERSGYWPVILGARDEMERVARKAAKKTWGTTAELIEKSLAVSGEKVLADAFDDYLSCRREDLVSAREQGDDKRAAALEKALASDDPFRCMPRGRWPRPEWPRFRSRTPYDRDTDEHLPEVFIALVPTKFSWQAPIYLNFGGFNDCPQPHEIASVLRYWETAYDVLVTCLTSCVLEMNVYKPAETREAALALAREQYLFDRDIVDQGTQTIEGLAAELLENENWYFWWD
jgi:hypothetical protein